MRRVFMVAVVVATMFGAIPALAAGSDLFADLSAANEVGGGDGDATGWAHVRLFRENRVCFVIEVEGLTTSPVAAHIHEGVAGVNGPVVVDLEWADNATGRSSAAGCVSADLDVIKDIRRNPGNYYINVHNPTVPSGAVRGQLGA